MTTFWTGKSMPEPTPESERDSPRRWYCPACHREIPINLNLIPTPGPDGAIQYRIAGFSIPSPCPWCGVPAIKEIAVVQDGPGKPGIIVPSRDWKPPAPNQ